MVPPASDKIPRVSPYSGYHKEFIVFRLQGFHLVSLLFPKYSAILYFFLLRAYGPTTPDLSLVWALSFSLATTQKIDFSFFSSSY